MNDFLGVLKDNLNINGDNVMYSGFSSGGPAPLAAAIAMREENPNSQPVVTLIDSICYRWLFYEKDENGRPIDKVDSEEMLDKLNGITIVDLYHDYGKYTKGDLEKLAKHGANVVSAYIDGGHSAVNNTFFNEHIIDFQSGNGNLDFLDKITFKKYSVEENKWVEITDRDEIEQIFLSIASNYIQSDGTDQDNYLKNMIDANKKNLRNLKTIKCDNEFVESNVNNIRSKIKNMAYLKTKTNGYFASTTSMPNVIIDRSYDIELTLTNKLEILAQSFYNLAEASGEVEEMDKNLSSIAGSIGSTGSSGGGWHIPSGGGSSSGITPDPTIPGPQDEEKKPDIEPEKDPDSGKEPDEDEENKKPNEDEENKTPDETPNEDENKEPDTKPDENENKEPDTKPNEDENKTPDETQKDDNKKPSGNNNSSSSGNKKPSSKPSKTPSKKPSSGNSSSKEEEKPSIVEIPDTPIEPEEEVPIEPEPEIPIEPEPEIPTIPEPEIPVIKEEPVVEEKTASPLKTIGILAGAGAAVGVGAYATHKAIEKKKNQEDRDTMYSDYEYADDSNEVAEEETNNEQMTPFDEVS